MIDNQYLRMMSRYNRWQNVSLFTAADNLSDADRKKDRSGFWNSIHGTLCHLYWADRIWLSRFDLVDPPGVPIKESSSFVGDWSQLTKKRTELDQIIEDWCGGLENGPIEGDLVWFSGAVNREMEAPLSVVLPHIFNHQTHHRGQVHAMLTAAGASTEDTDLFLMPEAFWANI